MALFLGGKEALRKALDYRNGKCEGLACAGLRDAYYILAVSGNGYGLVLYRGRDREFHAIEYVQYFWRDPEAVERYICLTLEMCHSDS